MVGIFYSNICYFKQSQLENTHQAENEKINYSKRQKRKD